MVAGSDTLSERRGRCDVEIDDLGAEFLAGDFEEAEGDGEVEAAGAAGAGVEVEDSFFGDVVGDVGVAVKDGGEFTARMRKPTCRDCQDGT